MKQHAQRMTEGNPSGLLFRFMLPTLIGNLLHQAYSITDSLIVGRVLGQSSLAAIGCTTPIIMLLAALMIGVNMGVSILLSQAYGQHDMDRMRRSFVNSLYLGVIMAGVMAIVGAVLAKPILHWMGTPEGPLQEAADYLRISFITTFCPLFYYLFSCAFRGMGDSRTALYCLITSVTANIGLDYLFVAVWGWGVSGSAWATALAQLFSAVFAAILLYVKYPEMRPKRSDLKADRQIFGDISRLAIPIALQSAFNNIGNIAAQRAVNTFGEMVMAAYTTGGRIGTLSLVPLETVGSSLAVYAGQNHGAGKTERVDQGVRAALRMELLFSIVLGGALALGGRAIAALFLKNPSPELIGIVSTFLWITAVPCILAGVMFVYQNALRGVGRAKDAMVGGILQLVVKVLATLLGSCLFHSLPVIWIAWPLSFVASATYLSIRYRKASQ